MEKDIMVTEENQQVLEILKECTSLLEGHFLLTSGKHSNRYCQCAQLLQYPWHCETIGSMIVKKLPEGITAVVGPAMGGIVIGYELARQLGVKSIFTERVEGEMTFRRGFTLDATDKVLIAEDVVTTGKSTLETAAAITAWGATVVGVGCLVDRRPPGIELPFPIYAATALAVDTYDANQCPLCKEEIPLVQPGSRQFK